MNNNLSDFDPLLFLGITDLKQEEKESVTKNLLVKMSQYLALRTAELLEGEDLKKIDHIDKLIVMARQRIPDFKNKVKEFMNDFKKDFNYNFDKIWAKYQKNQ